MRGFKLRPETSLWWEQAKRDYRIAQHNHQRRDYEAAVLFCEQSAQKAPKALVLHRAGRAPPKVHNLGVLGQMVGVTPKMSMFLTDLTPHYLTTRYPDAAGVVTSKLYSGRISLKFLRGTGKVLDWCRTGLR